MSARFLFDECVGKPVMEELAQALSFSNDQFEFKHIIDIQKGGTWDESWVPEVAKENWIIISNDRGKRGGRKKGEKLHVVCKKYGVTLVTLSGVIGGMGSVEKMAAIMKVWPDLIKLTEAPRGGRYLIRLAGKKYPSPVLVLIEPS